jgi:chromosome segregation ATPase
MSDETVSQPEDNVSRSEFDSVQEQLKAARAERDRQIFEKTEIVAKANTYAQERDEVKAQLASVLAERDKIIGDVVADHDKIVADLNVERDRLTQEKASAEGALKEATRRAVDASAEIDQLRKELEAKPPTDLSGTLLAILSEKTKASLAWVRSKIPADSPVLPYFDKTVEAVTKLGCMAVTLTKQFIVWATPRAIELYKLGKAKVEELLAQKAQK